MTDVSVPEATRRHLTQRQAEVVRRLIDATAVEVGASGYTGLTVRNVARRAGVAPATAYTYFSSKDHLLAELLWRRMVALPPVAADPDDPLAERLDRTVQMMVLLTTGSPIVVGACTAALLNATPDVKRLRDHIGKEIHRRFVDALGEGIDPEVVAVLEATYSGALLIAGMGHLAYGEVPGFVARAAALMVGTGPAGPA